MDVTVVVVPRERFTCLPESLRSLFTTIPDTVPVIVVEGDSPDYVREEVLAIKQERDFKYLSHDRMLLPNEARNIGGRAARSKYIVFTDNDISYRPNWLENLVAHADEHGSATVAPLTLIGPSTPDKIHHAGGSLRYFRKDGHYHISEVHRLSNAVLDTADFEAEAPVASEVCEFHCMLIRRDFFEAMGGLDERYITREHIDLALRLKSAGLKNTFCRNSVIEYRAKVPFKTADLRYMLYRWSDGLAVSGLKAFSEMWEAGADAKTLRGGWITRHRRRAIMSWLGVGPTNPLHVLVRRVACPVIEGIYWVGRRNHPKADAPFVPAKTPNPLANQQKRAA